jgi:co-chaperonin GroES (HSP10)
MAKKCCAKEQCSKDQVVDFDRSVVNSIKGCVPCGSQILVEMLTSQEILNTRLYLQNNKPSAEYQGFVLAVGPGLKDSDLGFSIGDRVLISGNGVPVPNYDNCERDRYLLEPHAIKGVLVS